MPADQSHAERVDDVLDPSRLLLVEPRQAVRLFQHLEVTTAKWYPDANRWSMSAGIELWFDVDTGKWYLGLWEG